MGANAETIRELFDGFVRGDLDAAFANVAPDAQIVTPETLPWGGTYTGPDGYKELIGKIADHFEEFHPEPQAVWEVEGDQVLVVVSFSGTTKSGNQVAGARIQWLYEIRDGQVVSGRACTDTALFLHALA